jgi:hypothetical protein
MKLTEDAALLSTGRTIPPGGTPSRGYAGRFRRRAPSRFGIGGLITVSTPCFIRRLLPASEARQAAPARFFGQAFRACLV